MNLERKVKKSHLFPLLGFLLGWGAPTGAMFLRFVWAKSDLSLYLFASTEWAQNSFFYWYMLLGTCLVLGVVGYLLGRAEES